LAAHPEAAPQKTQPADTAKSVATVNLKK
jgi:hypothetical protein